MWGEWMTSWKTQGFDDEAERIDRQKAAFGGDTVARIKDLSVLIVGCQGVGVETAKNLILSNVGRVTIWDPLPPTPADRGTNFYVTAKDVVVTTTSTAGSSSSLLSSSRAQVCLAELKSLNPFCKVDALEASSILTDELLYSKGGYTAVVVTTWHPEVVRINGFCRQNGIAFVVAVNHGVTSTLFSDFGLHHEITDEFGEPTQLLAVSNLEVLARKPDLLQIYNYNNKDKDSASSCVVLILTVAQADHGLDDGDVVVLDDLRGPLAVWNGHRVEVRRVAFQSPSDAGVKTSDVSFQESLKQSTQAVVNNFQKQYDYYKAKHQQEENTDEAADKKKTTFAVRTITMFNRLAIVLDPAAMKKKDTPPLPLPEGCTSWETVGDVYDSGGLLQQVRPPIVKSYASLQETLETVPVPQMLRGEDWEAGHGIDIHICWATALKFHQRHNRYPAVHNLADAQAFWELAQEVNEERKTKQQQQDNGKQCCWAQSVSFGFPSGEARELDKTRVMRFAKLFGTELTGFCAFLGGAAAQEVLKKTGKFTPLSQWLHHDEQVLVADEAPTNQLPLFGSRYDHQIAILGKDFQAKAANQRVFLVGCGALGCEYLKGLALMGVATGKHGKIYVTDMDRIEVSNLSRQFLFRDSDVGSPKSVSGARVVKGWNPQMNIEALERKVGPDTEDFFDDDFWEGLDVCWNALDNVLARRYTDSQCLLYSKPLLESGTLGTKCNHEVVLPYRTSTYNDGKESDENENQIAMCTLRSFPFLPLHCIEFAKQAYFSDYFEFGPDQYETFRKDSAGFFEQLEAMEPGEQLKSLRMIQASIALQEQQQKITFDDCVRISFDRMMEDFRTSVLNLCHSADAMEKSSGQKFWTGTKRRPRPVDWDDKECNAELMEYLYCTSNMYAVVWGLEPIRDRAAFQKVIDELQLKQPEWKPSSDNVDLSEMDDEDNSGGGDAAAEAEKLKADLYAVDVSKLQPAQPHDFEKDDDANFHVDFLTVSTNLRAWNYDIKSSQRHQVKITAGRIIPALATTTAMVCGLVDIEYCKLVLGLQSFGRDKFLNSNINLAAGSGNFTTFSPDPPIALKTGLESPQPETFTSWDKLSLAYGSENDLTVEQLVDYLEGYFGVTVDRIFAYGDTRDKALYSAVDKQKLTWDITIDDDGKPNISEGVFTQWPQTRMAAQMLGRLPPTSGQRKVFENQIKNAKASLDKTKEGFTRIFKGSVLAAFGAVYRPSDDDAEKQGYFDRVSGKRDYVLLGTHCQTAENPDIHLPCIKISFGEHAQKRPRTK